MARSAASAKLRSRDRRIGRARHLRRRDPHAARDPASSQRARQVPVLRASAAGEALARQLPLRGMPAEVGDKCRSACRSARRGRGLEADAVRPAIQQLHPKRRDRRLGIRNDDQHDRADRWQRRHDPPQQRRRFHPLRAAEQPCRPSRRQPDPRRRQFAERKRAEGVEPARPVQHMAIVRREQHRRNGRRHDHDGPGRHRPPGLEPAREAKLGDEERDGEKKRWEQQRVNVRHGQPLFCPNERNCVSAEIVQQLAAQLAHRSWSRRTTAFIRLRWENPAWQEISVQTWLPYPVDLPAREGYSLSQSTAF